MSSRLHLPPQYRRQKKSEPAPTILTGVQLDDIVRERCARMIARMQFSERLSYAVAVLLGAGAMHAVGWYAVAPLAGWHVLRAWWLKRAAGG